MKLIRTVFLLCALLTAQPGFSQTQPIGIQRSTTVVPDENGMAEVEGICLEKRVIGTPSPEEPVQAICGTLRVEFRDGRIRTGVPFMELLSTRLVRAACNGNTTKVYLRMDPSVARMTFESHAALADPMVNVGAIGEGSWQKLIDQVMLDVDPNLSQDVNQKRVHAHPFPYLEPATAEQTRILRSHRWDPADFMSLRYPMLDGQADCSLIKSPGGHHVVHDAGGSTEETLKLFSRVPLINGVRDVSVVFTHLDRDHVKGFHALLESGELDKLNVRIHEVFIGTSTGLTPSSGSPVQAQFLELLKSRQFAQVSGFDGFLRLVQNGREPLRVSKVTDLAVNDVLRDAGRPSPEMFEVEIEEGFAFTVFRSAVPQDITPVRHAYNLIVAWSHKGEGILDLGDASVAQLEELLITPLDRQRSRVKGLERELAMAEKAGTSSDTAKLRSNLNNERIGLRQLEKDWSADPFASKHGRCLLIDPDLKPRTIKWPHHAWVPTTARERNVMKALLRAGGADLLLVGMASGTTAKFQATLDRRLAAIQQILDEIATEDNSPAIQIITTKDMDTEFQVLLDLIQTVWAG